MAKKLSDFDSSKFPNWGGPKNVPKELKDKFIKLGLDDFDGVATDDVIAAHSKSINASKLLPTQNEVFLSKSLKMALGTPKGAEGGTTQKGIKGGYLGSIVSNDNYILDGHHRWAATMLSSPNTKITGMFVDLTIDILVPVLRCVGDVFGHERRGAPPGDASIFDSDFDDVMEAIETGKGMMSKSNKAYTPETWEKSGYKNHAKNWLNALGGESVLKRRFTAIKNTKPSSASSPSRINMPVIDDKEKQEILVGRAFKAGAIDVFPPYAPR